MSRHFNKTYFGWNNNGDTTMKYRAKRDFLSVTKGMEFSVDKDGDIELPKKSKSCDSFTYIDPTKYLDDFELVEEPKYTDSDLDGIIKRCDDLFDIQNGQDTYQDVRQAIKELRQSKEKKWVS